MENTRKRNKRSSETTAKSADENDLDDFNRQQGTALPPDFDTNPAYRTRTAGVSVNWLLCIGALLVVLIFASTAWNAVKVVREARRQPGGLWDVRGPDRCYSTQRGYQCNTEKTRLWAQYSPFFSSPGAPADGDHTDAGLVPQKCELEQVHWMARHGSRWPTSSRSAVFVELVGRLHDYIQTHQPSGADRERVGAGAEPSLAAKWAFLPEYSPAHFVPLSGLLTRFGQLELFRSGQLFFERYGGLLAKRVKAALDGGMAESDENLPGLFIRAGGVPRVVMSAQNFSDGFYAGFSRDRRTGEPDRKLVGSVRPILEIPEVDGVNNTLHHSLCDALEDHRRLNTVGRSEPQRSWAAAQLAGTAARIQSELAAVFGNGDKVGPVIKEADVISMMELCAFETSGLLADENDEITDRLHPFCDLFSTEEFSKFDYFHTLAKYYAFGPGSKLLGPAQGVGYVRELVSRLTGRPVEPAGSVNRTLDADPATFPIGGGWDVFADFGHDNDMVAVYAALGLFADGPGAQAGAEGVEPTRGAGGYGPVRALPTERRVEPTEGASGGFAISWLTSFGARMAVERWNCGEEGGERRVRVLVNERPVAVRWCAAGLAGVEGRLPTTCRLSEFAERLLGAGDFGWEDQCWL